MVWGAEGGLKGLIEGRILVGPINGGAAEAYCTFGFVSHYCDYQTSTKPVPCPLIKYPHCNTGCCVGTEINDDLITLANWHPLS